MKQGRIGKNFMTKNLLRYSILDRDFAMVILIYILGLLILTVPVRAETDSVLKNNLEMGDQWVNWYPGNIEINDEEIQLLAQQLQSGTEHVNIPRRIHDWICENIYYDWDSYNRNMYSTLQATEVLTERRSVCEGIANVTQSFFLSSNIPCIKVWGVAIPAKDTWETAEVNLEKVNHTWNEYYMNGHWHILDCTMDIQNRYENGSFVSLPGIDAFFDPDELFFAKTHKILYRGRDVLENIPSDWAKEELTRAVESGQIPLQLFANYVQPIDMQIFSDLIEVESCEDEHVTRAQAATMIAQKLKLIPEKNLPFTDIAEYDNAIQMAIATVYQEGIMVGTDETTFTPNAYLTRQEAIVVSFRIQERSRQ